MCEGLLEEGGVCEYWQEKKERKEQALLAGTGCGSSFVLASSLELVLHSMWGDWWMESEEWKWCSFLVPQFLHFCLVCCQCQKQTSVRQRTLKRLGDLSLTVGLEDLFAYIPWELTTLRWKSLISLRSLKMSLNVKSLSAADVQLEVGYWEWCNYCECRGMRERV